MADGLPIKRAKRIQGTGMRYINLMMMMMVMMIKNDYDSNKRDDIDDDYKE